MNNKEQDNMCNKVNNEITDEISDEIKREIEKQKQKANTIDSFVKGCIILNIFTISMNFQPILKDLQESLINKDFTIISLLILSIFSIISLILPAIEEFNYKKLTKDFAFNEESEKIQEEKENKIEEFYNKYNSWYKVQELASNVLKGIAIGFLLYFCATLGPKFNI